MSDRLGRANHLGNTAQFGLVHDAEGLHQSGSQHVGRFVFGENEELFDRDAQVLSNQFKRVYAGVMHAAFKPGQVARINLNQISQHFLRHASLFAEFLDSASQLLSRVHPAPCVVGGNFP